MTTNNNVIPIVKSEDYIPQLKSFEQVFLEVVSQCGLPTNNIFVNVNERANVFRNVDTVLQQIPSAQRADSIYLSKFLAATASGLFDAALNYLWDETIQEIRKRVIQYDVEYFYDNATNEEKRKKLKGPDDIVKLDDSELIQGARNIGLISELGYRHLDYIRYMRNWASAAHPNQNQLTGLQIISWLETCIKEVISLPISNIAVEIKKLLANIKTNVLSPENAKQIAPFFANLSITEVNNLCTGFSGIYVDPLTAPPIRQNINYLLPYLWERVDEETRQLLGIKYGKFIANNDKERASLARQFLEVVNAIAYIPDDLKAAEIETGIQNLLSVHRGFQNFYSEPVFAQQLANLVGKTGNIPKQVNFLYVNGIVEVFLTNGNGVAWNAEPFYLSLINKFDLAQSIIAMLSFTNERIASRLQFSMCKDKFNQLLDLIDGKITPPAARDLLSDIRSFSGPIDKMKDDSRMSRKVVMMQQIVG